MKAVGSQKRRRRYLWAAPKSRTATCWRRRSRVWASRLTRSSRRNSRSPPVRQISITPGGQHGDGMARLSGPNATVMARIGSAEITSGFPVTRPESLPRGSGIEEVLSQGIHSVCPVIGGRGGGCSPRLQSSDIMASRDLDEGIRPEFAPPRGARHPALWRGRRPAHRRPEADGVPLPGRRAFCGDLRRPGRRPVCRTGHLARADTHEKEAGKHASKRALRNARRKGAPPGGANGKDPPADPGARPPPPKGMFFSPPL